MRIGVDIDGVIANTFPLLVNELNTFFQKKLSYNDVANYNISKVFNLKNKQLYDFIEKKGNLLVEASQPMPGAVDCLNNCKHNFYLALVSARMEKFRIQTEEWLQRYHIPWDKLVLLGSHDKADTCIDLKLDIFIEDSLQNAIQISARGIPVILFDAPYNKGDLPNLVQRFCSWTEICKHLNSVKN